VRARARPGRRSRGLWLTAGHRRSSGSGFASVRTQCREPSAVLGARDDSHIIAVTAEWLEAKRVYLGAAQAEGRRDMQAEEFYLARCAFRPHDQPAHLQAGFRVEIACHCSRPPDDRLPRRGGIIENSQAMAAHSKAWLICPDRFTVARTLPPPISSSRGIGVGPSGWKWRNRAG
jgi:hypothetical protein